MFAKSRFNTSFINLLGTSTGSLIAFGLVGGKEDQKGKRIPLSVKEVTELYQEVIPKIFKKAKTGKGWIDWALEWKVMFYFLHSRMKFLNLGPLHVKKNTSLKKYKN